MKCENCGNEVAAGSEFCDYCGHRMSNVVTCPECHEQIPAGSVFCPECGRKVRDDINEAGTRRQTYNELHRNDANQPQSPYYVPEDEDQDDDGGNSPSHFNRNVLMGAIAIVALIALLHIMRHCNGQHDRRLEAQADSVAVVAEGTQDPLAIFNAELSRNNMTSDNAIGASAVRFPGVDPEDPDRIVGFTYKNDTERPFVKVYVLNRSGSTWTPELTATKYLDGRTINPANTALMADASVVPRAVKVNGQDCLFFGFVDNLRGAGEGNNGRVTLCLYDLEAKKLTALNYDGTIKSRTDGRQYIYGKPLESTSGWERSFLSQEARRIKVIYFPTAEELQAEEEARQKAEEEKALAGEENAGAKWEHDNDENMDKLQEGEEVKVNTKKYDKPIVNMKDIANRLENDKYLVLVGKDGSVYGFTKDSRKYFVIYKPSSGGAATDVRFGGDGNLHVKTAGGSTISYDLANGRAKTVN